MKKIFYKILTVAIAVFLLGCRGGGTDPFATQQKVVPGRGGSLVCPQPEKIPFTLESHTFLDKDKVAQVMANGVVNHYILDFIGHPGDPQTLSGQATYGIDLLQVLNGQPADGISNEWVSIWWQNAGKEWLQLGRVKTDNVGLWSLTLPQEQALAIGANRVYMVLEGNGSCAEGGVFVYPAGTQFVVTDLDGTMTRADSEVMQWIQDPSYKVIPNDGAVDLMKKYDELGYVVMYLTARPYHLRMHSREWLTSLGFPFGMLETTDKFVFGDTAVAYKAGFLKRMIQTLGYKLLVAYGNAESDIDAYDEIGIPKNRTFIIGKENGKKNTMPIAEQVQTANGEVYSFRQHMNQYVDKIPPAKQPF